MAISLEQLQKSVLLRALPLSERVVEAFYQHPRHLFVPEYSLEEAYEDHPLTLFHNPPYVSTISQPSFVLRILDLLKIEPGQKIFELGTGSGWNTALIAFMVGSEGRVISMEIVPEMAERAREILFERQVLNARVLVGDGFEGLAAEAPFDRVIFTAGAKDFPVKLFAQLKESGWMVFVRKGIRASDILEVIHKVDGEPHIVTSVPCSFVPVVRKKEGPDSKDRDL